MKLLTITTEMMSHTNYIRDHVIADAAHAALKGAIESYDKFGNDKKKAITFQLDSGEKTYRVDDLVSVSICDLALDEDTIIEREIWFRQLEAKITARLAPQT